MTPPAVLVIGVIYNTYPETLRYVESIAGQDSGGISLLLSDNSTKPCPADFMQAIRAHPFVKYIRNETNLGYFGGARRGLETFLQGSPEYPAWILVTNVDIVFTPGFFERLMSLPQGGNTAVIAPAIISYRWGSDYNPKLVSRYGRGRMKFYLFLYSCFIFHNIFILGAYARKWLKGLKSRNPGKPGAPAPEPRRIYAPHGSCIIFSRRYFEAGGKLELRNFLFGEEIMVAETAGSLGLDVVYDPSLSVTDHEHASTGLFISPVINRFNREAVRVIIENYYS